MPVEAGEWQSRAEGRVLSDFNVKITVRNGRLLRRIREKFGTTAELCRVSGSHITSVSALLTMRASPFLKDGGLSKTAETICSALGAYPDDLWPEHMRDARKQTSAEVELSAADVEQIASDDPERAFLRSELVQRWIKQLPPRARYVVEQRMGNDVTLDELAREMGGISRGRVAQIEAIAHQKLREYARRDRVLSHEDLEA